MDSESLTLLMSAINNVGFPIVMIGYLIFRFEKKIDALTQAIEKLLATIKS